MSQKEMVDFSINGAISLTFVCSLLNSIIIKWGEKHSPRHLLFIFLQVYLLLQHLLMMQANPIRFGFR